ncbi:caspase family protein [Streptomyces rhizosphaericus]|uniref:Caspase family protein n=1 Tax=Streptomyces rhizosphaericus TaxID=114699 RepID=A0A6G4ALE6_9ACTN|nr:caspase family protein [Streptomyces rhizosphaericus]NEW74165.1 caspase family protein [Streptomyces rhizosphaericus]
MYRALLIGNSEFPGDPDHLRSLLGPPADVSLLAAALMDPDTGLHQADAVRTVLEETAQRIRDELEEFFESALTHEQLFLYYSGHGLLDLRNRLRLCARDTTVRRLQARSVDLEFINGLIDGCAARSIVVILDCCFSGAAAVKGQDPAARLAGHGRFVMTSSSHGDTSADAEEAGAASPFTRHLVTGLRSGAPGRDGLVTAYDIYRYVHGRLRASGQIPHMKTEAGVGAIPLARRPPQPAETETTDAPARAAGDDAAPLDVRPVFTDPDGNRSLLATYTDFSGVLHVHLPQHGVVLTTHRDEITASGEGTPVTAELYRHADVTWRDIHARVSGHKMAELRADSSGGAVSFDLPGDAGTVEWQQSQVRAFRQASSRGRWPGTPLAPNSTANEYKTDRGYRRLRAAAWRVLLWSLSALVLMTAVQGALTGDTWYERAGRTVIALAIGVCVIQALRYLGDAWRFLHIRSVLRSSGLYAVPMLMKTGWEEEVIADSSSGGFIGGFKVDDKPFAWLRYDSAPQAPPAQGEPDGILPEEEEWPMWRSLAVPLHHFHSRDITERSDRSDRSGIEHVEVIGTPKPGRWVIIRTEDGMLWPHAKAQ